MSSFKLPAGGAQAVMTRVSETNEAPGSLHAIDRDDPAPSMRLVDTPRSP